MRRAIAVVSIMAGMAGCKGGGFGNAFGHLGSGLGHAASGLGHVASGVASGVGHVASSGIGHALGGAAKGAGHVGTALGHAAVHAGPAVVDASESMAEGIAEGVIEGLADGAGTIEVPDPDDLCLSCPDSGNCASCGAPNYAPPGPVSASPAPTQDEVGNALVKPGVYKLVELCRTTYAPYVDNLRVHIQVPPSGDAANVELPESTGRFAECATRALRTANFAPFDGNAPVEYELQLGL